MVSSSWEIESCFDTILEFDKECEFRESRYLTTVGLSYFIRHIPTDVETIHGSFDIFCTTFPFATGTSNSLEECFIVTDSFASEFSLYFLFDDTMYLEVWISTDR